MDKWVVSQRNKKNLWDTCAKHGTVPDRGVHPPTPAVRPGDVPGRPLYLLLRFHLAKKINISRPHKKMSYLPKQTDLKFPGRTFFVGG